MRTPTAMVTREILGAMDRLPGTTPWMRATDGMPVFDHHADHVVHYGGILEKPFMAVPLQRALGMVNLRMHISQTGPLNMDSDAAAIRRLGKSVDRAARESLREGGTGNISLLGHSRGGVVALKYAMSLDDDALSRISQVVALGSPFDGVNLLKPSLSGAVRQAMPVPGLRSLIHHPGASTRGKDEFASFMDRYRSINPDGRVVSVMADRGSGHDGLVSHRASRLPDVPGAHNVMIGTSARGQRPDHNSIGGTIVGMHDDSIRTVAYLLAGRDVPDAVANARTGPRSLRSSA